MTFTTTIGAFSKQGFSAGEIANSGWITVGSGSNTGYPEFGYSIALNSTNEVVVVGIDQENTAGGAQNQAYLAKLNADGTINFELYLASPIISGFAYNADFQGVAIDSSNNMYCIGTSVRQVGVSNYPDAIFLVKYDSTGSQLWQRQLDSSGTNANERGKDIAVDSSGNSFIIANVVQGTSYSIVISKYNTSGTLQWSKTVSGLSPSTFSVANSIILDSTGNAYFSAYITSTLYIFKVSTSGTLLWQKEISGITSGAEASLSINGSNLCIAASNGYILFSEAGSLIRQQSLSVGTSAVGTAMDSSGNVYVITQALSPNVVYITQLNSAGVVQYVRSISSLTIGFRATSVVYKNNKLYISMYSTFGADIWVMNFPATTKIPSKGYYIINNNGNTFNVQYAVTNTTATTTTYSFATGSLSLIDSGFTSYNSSISEGSRTLIWTTKAI